MPPEEDVSPLFEKLRLSPGGGQLSDGSTSICVGQSDGSRGGELQTLFGTEGSSPELSAAGPLGFEGAQHWQTLRPPVDGTRSEALRPFGSEGTSPESETHSFHLSPPLPISESETDSYFPAPPIPTW